MASDLIRYQASLWLLSPSCQPYTDLNPKKKEAEDPRAASFLRLVHTVLPELVSISAHPQYILVENVSGFKDSAARSSVVETLERAGYHVKEFLLSPLQCGIPNSRLRYYLLASTSPPHSWFKSGSSPESKVHTTFPGVPPSHEVLPLCHYLDDEQSVPASFKVPDKVLARWGVVFDIVLPSSRRTCCFTRGYTHLIQGAGSILQTDETVDTTLAFLEYAEIRDITILHQLKLRYFTPSEILRLSHFTSPTVDNHNFKWPGNISERSKYRLLGNSVNVHVISKLLHFLLPCS